jgi:hypothetical protein
MFLCACVAQYSLCVCVCVCVCLLVRFVCFYKVCACAFGYEKCCGYKKQLPDDAVRGSGRASLSIARVCVCVCLYMCMWQQPPARGDDFEDHLCMVCVLCHSVHTWRNAQGRAPQGALYLHKTMTMMVTAAVCFASRQPTMHAYIVETHTGDGQKSQYYSD